MASLRLNMGMNTRIEFEIWANQGLNTRSRNWSRIGLGIGLGVGLGIGLGIGLGVGLVKLPDHFPDQLLDQSETNPRLIPRPLF